MAHVPYDFGLMYRIQGHFHAKEFLLILCGQCHLKMDIYYLGVRIAINAHEEILFFEIQLCAYMQLLADYINSGTII